MATREKFCTGMRKINTILQTVWKRGGPFLPIVLFIMSALLWGVAGDVHADTDIPEIIYAKSGSANFSATLAPDSETGVVPPEDSLIKVNVNGTSVPVALSTNPQGQIEINGSLPDLPDGRHKAAIETCTPDEQPVDGRQLLLVVDSAPPVIELVGHGDAVPRTSFSLLFAVKETENGSGIAADPEACALQVDITGANVFAKAFVLKNQALHLLVTVTYTESIAPPDYPFNVNISLKDRAGNMGRFTREFKTTALIQPGFVKRCEENDTSILTTLGVLVYAKEKGLQLKSGENRSLSFFAYGNYGKDYTYPPVCVNDHGKTAPEFIPLSDFIQKMVGRRIEIIAGPDSISVQKQADQDYADNRMTFNVFQKSAVPMGEQVAFLQVRVPVSFSLDKTIDYCPYDDYAEIPENAFTFAYETITVPVVQEVADQPVKMRVFQDGGDLVSQVGFDAGALLDTAASWFEIEGEKYWYTPQGDRCTARGPVREGTVHYRVAIAHTLARFQGSGEGGDAGGSTFHNEGDFIVKLSPPLINAFSYDRQTNTLSASITDEGTPAGDLDIKLGLPGYDINFDFNQSIGKVTAALSFTPLSVLEASIRVTDRAGQTTSAACTVFGNAETGNVLPSENAGAVYSESVTRRDTRNSRVIGAADNGRHLVRVCSQETLQWGLYNKGEFISVGPGSATLVRMRSKKASQIPIDAAAQNGTGGESGGRVEVKLFFDRYDTALYEPVSGGSTSVGMSMVGGTVSDTAAKRTIYYITGYDTQGRFIPTSHNIGLSFTTRAVEACRVETRDISSPVIRASYDSRSGQVTGRIHDSGMPLSQLEIGFSGRNDSRNSHPYRKSLPFTFKNGQFEGTFEPPSQGEFFSLEIRAADRAGNIGMATLKAVIPRSPPELEIRVETETSDLIFGHNSFDINACMSADATDDSEILPEGTTFWLDGQVLAQVNQLDMRPYQMRSSAFERRAFHYQGLYAAKIAEGEHVARFRATDATGLSAETVRPFEFSLAPVIRDFKMMPGAVLKAGGPVFSAMVFDRGGDLDVTGLSVDINGEPVAANRLYYDPASGYFAVDGPLDFSDGRHTAQLTAVDSQGNRVNASLQFIRRLQVVLTPGPEDDADLRIDTVSMMELRDHNGDGQANPGELIRLFIPLRNDSRQSVEQCRAVLVTGNEAISVETKDVLYGRIEPGAVVMPMKGFDLRISRDVLSGIVSDPHDIHFDLTVTCASENEWRLPLILPIYRPSVPVEISSAVNLTIDRLPPATHNAQIQLNGDVTSSGAFIATVVVRVNGTAVNPVTFNREGGRFEAAVPLEVGPNVIEVMATDQTGAQGYAADNIQRAPIFKPPEVHIATPAENAFFQCGTLVVTGTYNSGSSDISQLTVKVPWSPISGCPVTIIDNSNFTADCGPVIPIGGVYSIDASIETVQGFQAQDTRGIIVGDCF